MMLVSYESLCVSTERFAAAAVGAGDATPARLGDIALAFLDDVTLPLLEDSFKIGKKINGSNT
jgi:hypothetical protein